MNILVIGSEGFIGSNLVRFFRQQGYHVAGCDIVHATKHEGIAYAANDKSEDFFYRLFGMQNPDVCINASGSGNVSYSIQQPVNDFEANCTDVIRVLDAMKVSAPDCKYIHLSSAAVYGNPHKLPVVESDELKPLSPYGWHKLLSEQICREYFELYNLQVAILRPFSVYGNGLQKQLLWDVCRKLNGADSVSLFGTGNESRDFIHINDLAYLIGLVITHGKFNCEIYNAACGEEITINNIASIIAGEFENKTITFSGEVKQGDPLNWKADISKITSIGFQPAVELVAGVKDYVNWYKREVNAH